MGKFHCLNRVYYKSKKIGSLRCRTHRKSNGLCPENAVMEHRSNNGAWYERDTIHVGRDLTFGALKIRVHWKENDLAQSKHQGHA